MRAMRGSILSLKTIRLYWEGFCYGGKCIRGLIEVTLVGKDIGYGGAADLDNGGNCPREIGDEYSMDHNERLRMVQIIMSV